MTLLAGGYGRLVRDNAPPIAFGFLHTFLSSPGQTFFVALFVGAFATSLGVDEATLGIVYLVATLGAACVLPLVGHWIDHLDLRVFTGLATAGLGLACLATAGAQSVLMLAVALMLLRLTGQGLMMHVGATAIARYFGRDRGKALGLTSLGLPLSEAMMPLAATTMIAVWGWREAYAAIGITVIVLLLPLSQLLLVGQREFNAPSRRAGGQGSGGMLVGMATLARSRFFWRVMPILLFAPFVGTSLLFHIGPIGATKGWPISLVAQAFVIYALCHTVSLFLVGPLIDRLTARGMLTWMLVPMFLGMAVLATSDHPIVLFAFLGLMAMSTGATMTTVSAIWAEVYGPAVVGSVRSAGMTLMVAASAAGPAALGFALTAGVPIPVIVATAIAGGLAAIALASRAPHTEPPVHEDWRSRAPGPSR